MRSAEASVVDCDKNHIPLPGAFLDLQDTVETRTDPLWSGRNKDGLLLLLFSILTEPRENRRLRICQSKVIIGESVPPFYSVIKWINVIKL